MTDDLADRVEEARVFVERAPAGTIVRSNKIALAKIDAALNPPGVE